MNDKNILFYDSECSLCSRFQKALEMLDKGENLAYLSVHEEEIYQTYPMLNQQACEKEVHLIDTEGNIFVGAEVIEFLVKLIPGVSKFSWLIESESSKKAMDMFYGKLNDIRKMKKRNCYTCGSTMKTHMKKHFDVRGKE